MALEVDFSVNVLESCQTRSVGRVFRLSNRASRRVGRLEVPTKICFAALRAAGRSVGLARVALSALANETRVGRSARADSCHRACERVGRPACTERVSAPEGGECSHRKRRA